MFCTVPPAMSKLRCENERRRSSSHCGYFLTKGTEITKDILEKFEEGEIGPEKAKLCGRNFNTRQLWVLAGLCLLFSASCLCMALMFGTDTFDSYLLSNLILSNTSTSYRIWKGPMVKTFTKVYVFNYTNVDRFESGEDSKLHVEEIGPYVYEETAEKVNVRFNPNGTVSYQERRAHQYRDDLSFGRLKNETVVVPNLPFLAAASRSANSFYLFRSLVSKVFKGLDSNPFLNVEVDKFLWGYDDDLFALGKNLLSFETKLPFDKIGMLTSRNGLSKTVFNVHTGMNDINKVQQVDRVNGERSETHWTTEKCNRIKGSDGSSFSPFDIRNKRPVSIYSKDMCRSLSLVYDKDVQIFNGKITAHRYVLPVNAFDAPDTNPENICYCNKETGECPPQGLFSAEACLFDVPIFMSFPHFYHADPSIRQAITGLKENPPQVETYVNVHPKLGFAMAGKHRMQINVQVRKSFGMEQLDRFEDDMFLPMVWFDMGVEENELPEFVRDGIYAASITAAAIETCLKYGSLLSACVTLTAIFIILRGKWIQRRKKVNVDLS